MMPAADPNPLLDFTGLPRFDAIGSEHVVPAVDALLAEARAVVEAVVADARPPSWDNVAEPLADALDRTERAWGAVAHLNAVVSTPDLRDAYHASLPKITAFYADITQDRRLYARYKALSASPGIESLDVARRKVIDNELRDFRLGGAELPDAEKSRLKAVDEELADLSAQFDDNVLDATNAWALYVERRGRPRGHPGRRPGRGAVRRRGRRQAWMEADAAHALLPSGDDVRRKPLAARDAASGLRDPGLGTRRKAGMGQFVHRPAHPRVAPRGRRSPRLPGFRRTVAGHENGR